jgi:hypothetical protein
MTTQLQDTQALPRYRLLGDLANRISGYSDVRVTMDEVKGLWLRVAYHRSCLLVSAEDHGRDGWFYQWGNQKDRSGPVSEITAIAQQIVMLLMSRQRS